MVTRQLPSGTYRHDITRPGFATYVGMVEVGVALPTRVRVALGVASLSSGLTVTPDARLLDHVSATF